MSEPENAPGGSGSPTEVLMLCVDVSSSMSKSVGREFSSSRTRIQVVGIMLNAFIERTLRYGYTHHIGLITYNDSVQQRTSPSSIIDYIQVSASDDIDRNDAGGLLQAISAVVSELQSYGSRYPTAKRRIALFTDLDYEGDWNAFETCMELQKLDILLDSFLVGPIEGYSTPLTALVDCTAGYRFSPENITEAVCMSELETVLAASERPLHGVEMRRKPIANLSDYESVIRAYNWNDCVRGTSFPPLALGTMLSDFIPLESFTLSDDVLDSRLHQEFTNLRFSQRPYQVLVNVGSISKYKVILPGPLRTVYECYEFELEIDLTRDFPTRPPKIRFVSKILHPNITRQGRILHPILAEEWSRTTTVVEVLDAVRLLLQEPDLRGEWSGHVNCTATDQEITEYLSEAFRRSGDHWWGNYEYMKMDW